MKHLPPPGDKCQPGTETRRTDTETATSVVADAVAPDHGGGPPADTNPEHPRHYHEQARRLRRRLDDGDLSPNSLGRREFGVLAYWYPSVVTGNGGEPK